VALFALIRLGAGNVIAPTVSTRGLGRDVGVEEYARLARFVASLATVGAALGTALESDEAVREAAYALTPKTAKREYGQVDSAEPPEPGRCKGVEVFRAVLASSLGLAAIAASGIGGVAGPEASPTPDRTFAPAAQLSQLLGFANATLVRIDPESLQPLSGKGIRVGSGGCAARLGGTACWSLPPWTVSPDGQRLALARNVASSLQLVDVGRMSVTATVRVNGGAIGALAWLAPARVVAVQELNGERQRVLTVDVVKRRVVARRVLGGSVQRLARTREELVLLLAPAAAIGPARIAVVDRGGAIRFVQLDRILAGSKLLGTGSEHAVESQLPGLAVDPESRRVFVVGKDEAAEIDLKSGTVSYHRLEHRSSFLSRLWSWLEPAAAAKQVSGHSRDARWLGGNLLAVSGSDTEQGAMQPTGLLVVDTSDWSVRSIDRGATGFHVAGDVLLALGGSWDAATERATGIGLAAYGFDGSRRFQLFDGELAWLAQVYGGRAYVGISGQETLRIVDLATGSVLATRQQPLPWLLLGEGAGWWGG
jgi:hypothetical protein